MGKKKVKDANVSPPSSIFSTLFGGASAENVAVSSIFSDDNPFKRKAEETLEPQPVFESKGSESLGSDTKKRKKSMEKIINLDSDSVEEEATQTPITQNPNITNDQQGTNPDVDISGEERKQKKRKRDEVERKYEEKKYGVKAEEEVESKVVVGTKRKKADSDNPEMYVTSKEDEGFDDETKLLRTIFVGNLPLKVKKKALLKEFSKFGEIDSVRIRSVPVLDTKKPRKGAILTNQINDNADSVHAYIVYKSHQSAEAALAHNMAVVEGNHIRVDRACPPRKKLKGDDTPLYDNKRTIFVGNLPFDVKDEEIYQLFCGLNNLGSSVEAVRVVRHPHMRVGKGIAYVLFKTREAANLVLKKRYLKLRDRELRLSRATEQNSTPSKRKNASPASAGNFTAKKFAADSRTPGSANRSNSKVAISSYQGLKASKSGTQKKVHSGSVRPMKMKKSGEKPKERQHKRPTVAERKARAKGLNSGGDSTKQGVKRKFDGQTPESSQRKNKGKKFR